MNCSVCPEAMLFNSNTSVTCVVSGSVFNNSNICTLSVETFVCGSKSGNESDTVTAVLKGTYILQSLS